jgi:hypothetical protein
MPGAFEKRSLSMPVTLHLGCCLVSDQPAAADGVVLAVCVPELTKSCVALKDTTYLKSQSWIVQPRAKGGRMIAAHMLHSANSPVSFGHPQERRNPNRGRTMATFA